MQSCIWSDTLPHIFFIQKSNNWPPPSPSKKKEICVNLWNILCSKFSNLFQILKEKPILSKFWTLSTLLLLIFKNFHIFPIWQFQLFKVTFYILIFKQSTMQYFVISNYKFLKFTKYFVVEKNSFVSFFEN